MRRRAWGWTLAVLTAGGVAGAATDAQLAVSAASGVSDNVLGVASDQPAGAPQPEADVFFSVSPRLRVWRESPRLLLAATLGASLSRFVDVTQANAVELRGGLSLDRDLAPTWKATVALSGAYVDSGTVNPEGAVGAVPQGSARYVNAGLALGLNKDLSARWRFVESARLSLLEPVGDDSTQVRSFSVGNGVGVQVSRQRDAFEVRLDGAINRYAERAEIMMDAQTDYTVTLTGGWVRELTPFWGLAVSAGGTLTVVDEDTALAPVARAALSRRGRDVTFTAALAQTVTANLLVAETLSSSEVTLTLAARVARKLTIDVSAGAAHSRDLVSSDDPSINTVRSGARVEYRMLDNLGVGLAHELLYQVTGAPADGGDSLTLRRNTVTLSVNGYWPTDRPHVTPQGSTLRVRETEERERVLREPE